jgi:two-component system chemotaxis response regulator CheY
MKALDVLIIDDSSVMRKIVGRALKQSGVELGSVFEAGDGVEGLAAVKKNPLDLIFCDINMPTMDGMEFLRQLRNEEKGKSISVVMVTTEGSESHVVDAISLGAKGYIRKPFTADQVKDSILSVMEPQS